MREPQPQPRDLAAAVFHPPSWPPSHTSRCCSRQINPNRFAYVNTPSRQIFQDATTPGKPSPHKPQTRLGWASHRPDDTPLHPAQGKIPAMAACPPGKTLKVPSPQPRMGQGRQRPMARPPSPAQKHPPTAGTASPRQHLRRRPRPPAPIMPSGRMCARPSLHATPSRKNGNRDEPSRSNGITAAHRP
jgi:hypothetical protein